MIWAIASREIHDNILSAKFALTTILCLILITLGTYVSIQDYQRRMDEYSAGVKDQQGAGGLGRPKAYKRPEPLSIFSQGMERKVGSVADHIHYFSVGAVEFKGVMRESESVYLKLLMPIDFDFIVRVVMSLLALFLSYNAISGDRESGILKLIMSGSVPRSHFIAGKFISGILCLSISLLLSFLVSIMIIELSGKVSLGSSEWYRIFIMLALSLLYLACFYALGILVSTLTRDPSISLMICILLWLVLLFVIPNIGPAFVKRFYPVTSSIEMLRARGRIGHERGQLEEEKFGSWDKRDNSPEGRLKILEFKNETSRVMWNKNQEFLSEMNRHSELARWSARISPASAFSFSLNSFSRTDPGNHMRLVNATYGFFRQMDEIRKIYYTDEAQYKERSEKYQYTFRTPGSISDSFSDALMDIALLLIFCGIFFLTSYTAFIRYDIR